MIELIGRFQVQERIGEGAMADVFRAYDPTLRRALAIKVLKDQYREDPEYASRFLREAKAAGALAHPNIVTIYDVGEVSGYPYIAMELLDGRTLNEAIARDGALPPDAVLEIGRQLADALRYAHQAGVVHRDIKPSNIILGTDGRSVKLLDFGIARVAEGLLDADQLKTQVGQVLGTPRYMSPEQAMGLEIDGRSDLFSLGVVMYEMITGRRAFGGGSAATLALQITQQEPEPIAKLAPGAPRGLQFIIGKLMAKRRDRRFADGASLAEALRREQATQAAVSADTANRRYLTLPVRTTAVMGLLTAAVLAVTVIFVLNRQTAALQRAAITSGAAMTSFVATNAALTAADNATLPPDRQDWLPVRAFVRAAAGDRNVAGIEVVDADGVVRAAADPSLIDKPYRKPAAEKVVALERGLTVTTTRTAGGEKAFRYVGPITYSGRPIGRVDVSILGREMDQARQLTSGLLLLLGVIVLGVVAAATFVVTRGFAQPLKRLRRALDDAASGDLDFRLSHDRTDEIGELFDAFNRMGAALQERLELAEGDASPEPSRAEPAESPPADSPFAAPRADAHNDAAASQPEPDQAPEPGPDEVAPSGDSDRTMIADAGRHGRS